MITPNPKKTTTPLDHLIKNLDSLKTLGAIEDYHVSESLGSVTVAFLEKGVHVTHGFGETYTEALQNALELHAENKINRQPKEVNGESEAPKPPIHIEGGKVYLLGSPVQLGNEERLDLAKFLYQQERAINPFTGKASGPNPYAGGNPLANALAPKTMTNTTAKGARTQVKDIEFWGNGDTFTLISKASSQAEGWMKSTKAMEIFNVGCVVQVTTQQKNPDGSYSVAEAVTFVPGVRIAEKVDKDGKVIERMLVHRDITFAYGADDMQNHQESKF